MQLKYGLDDHPPLPETLLFGLQWFAVTIPIIVIIGKVTAGLQFAASEDEIVYLQKLTFVMAAALLVQILAGHRLPLITGPSSVLLIGIISSHGSGADAIYTSILLGGILLSILSITGLFAHLQRLFTARIVAVVLLLIAFTLSPTILHLVTSPASGSGPLANLSFALGLTAAMFFFYRHLRGIWKSTIIIWAMIAGSLLYLFLFPVPAGGPFQSGPLIDGFFRRMTPDFTLHAGVLISFLFCFTALTVNDLGSIQAMNEILKPPGQPQRITRGIFVTGLANVLAGFFGVIGPVNFSLSPGVLASTGCASRFALLPAAALLGVISFSPLAIALLGNVPSVVIGCVLLFIMCSQFGAGLAILFESAKGYQNETGLIIGLPILLGTLIAFLPSSILAAFPAVLRPILGNGFVVGVSAALVLEHLVFRDV